MKGELLVRRWPTHDDEGQVVYRSHTGILLRLTYPDDPYHVVGNLRTMLRMEGVDTEVTLRGGLG